LEGDKAKNKEKPSAFLKGKGGKIPTGEKLNLTPKGDNLKKISVGGRDERLF